MVLFNIYYISSCICVDSERQFSPNTEFCMQHKPSSKTLAHLRILGFVLDKNVHGKTFSNVLSTIDKYQDIQCKKSIGMKNDYFKIISRQPRHFCRAKTVKL